MRRPALIRGFAAVMVVAACLAGGASAAPAASPTLTPADVDGITKSIVEQLFACSLTPKLLASVWPKDVRIIRALPDESPAATKPTAERSVDALYFFHSQVVRHDAHTDHFAAAVAALPPDPSATVADGVRLGKAYVQDMLAAAPLSLVTVYDADAGLFTKASYGRHDVDRLVTGITYYVWIARDVEGRSQLFGSLSHIGFSTAEHVCLAHSR